MAVVLVVGSTGAGKTTYSNQLAREISAVVYSIDNWMKALYWQDMPANPDNAWFVANGQWYVERIQRCEDLISQLASAYAEKKQNVILDLGFSTSQHRIKFIQTFHRQGFDAVTHYLDVPSEVRWQRVQRRNQQKGESFVMHVDRQMFDYIESIFEPPQITEGAEIAVIHQA